MIKPSFNIVPSSTDLPGWEQTVLTIEVGTQSLGCVWYNQQHQKLMGLKHYQLDALAGKSTLELMEEILKEDEAINAPVSKVVMVYHFAESSLVPEKLFQATLNRPLLELMFGDTTGSLVLSEKINDLPVYNVYRIPSDVHQLFQQKFDAFSYWHYNSLQLSFFQIEKDSPADMLRLRVVFYADKFVVGAFREDDLLIFQSFQFQTPEDVSYYLLTLVQAHDTAPENVILKISGLIAEDSILYTELLKYFQHLLWDGLPDAVDPEGILKDYPRHYFSPLVRLALCV